MHRSCSTCSQPISEKRLQAVPNARQCVPCKAQEEQPCQPNVSNMARLAHMLNSTSDRCRVRKPLKFNVVTHGLAGAISGGYGF